ncbi:MAG TPA: Y4yA family PLP-dependent enzyme [Trinickia sp.]|uniref:Y4yA family PLP-dependent enzyme n=1 Tax=Trinickia sp. TaxID=2571163 RepID=UPI002CC5580D|nr:Y4yA family PLP-dependent enzyme [Trinickia sp.]HVW51250.1 Y4yA family PLP-dependent enzyme [Trinickia sp.]
MTPMPRDVSSEPSAKTQARHGATPAALPPIAGPAIERLIRSPQALIDMTRTYGSPLNVVLPQVLPENVERLRAVLRRHEVQYRLYYGAKVNKSPGLVRAAVAADIGVDVSSLGEMRDALRAGIDPARLCATGPAKTRVFHMALVANGALISVDSLEEFGDLEAVAREVDPARPVRVLLRYRPSASSPSRFGMAEGELRACLDRLALKRQTFSFEGFHFHLGGYRHESRVTAVCELARFVDMARAMGLDPKVVDIGGGLPVRYVARDAYDAFLGEQSAGHYRNGKVPASFYPYGGPIEPDAWLDRLLGSPCEGGRSIAGYLKAQALTLAIEPGRSLADQTAISIFRVTRVKAMAPGEVVIFVEGSSFSACETWFASEFLVDPIHIRASRSRECDAVPARGWIAGHSCLDEDVITNRWLAFAARPEAGDLLVYANTAGYQMDLLENEFHRHPVPRRIAVTYDAAGGFDITPDDRMEKWNDFD